MIETRTAEDHDDENLHNPETVQDAFIHLEVDEVCCCCCFSHSAYWLPTRKKNFTRWPIPLVVC